MIIDNFKLLDSYFKKTTQMIIEMSNTPERLAQCEEEVYKDETKLVLSEMSVIVDKFREKFKKTPMEKMRFRINRLKKMIR